MVVFASLPPPPLSRLRVPEKRRLGGDAQRRREVGADNEPDLRTLLLQPTENAAALKKALCGYPLAQWTDPWRRPDAHRLQRPDLVQKSFCENAKRVGVVDRSFQELVSFMKSRRAGR